MGLHTIIKKSRNKISQNRDKAYDLVLDTLTPLKTQSSKPGITSPKNSMRSLQMTPIMKYSEDQNSEKDIVSPSSKKSIKSLISFLDQIKFSAKKSKGAMDEEETDRMDSEGQGEVRALTTGYGSKRAGKLDFSGMSLREKKKEKKINFGKFFKKKEIKKRRRGMFKRPKKKIKGPKVELNEDKREVVEKSREERSRRKKKEDSLEAARKKIRRRSTIFEEDSVMDFDIELEEGSTPVQEEGRVFKLKRNVSSKLIMEREKRLMNRVLRSRRKKHVKIKIRQFEG